MIIIIWINKGDLKGVLETKEVKRALELEGPRERRAMEMGSGHWIHESGFGIRRAQGDNNNDNNNNNNNNNNKVLK